MFDIGYWMMESSPLFFQHKPNIFWKRIAFLIMVDFINKARREGLPTKQAVLDSGVLRFRPIILTSLTTAAGLMPILLETSVQAQYVIPMAISLSFGILFATAITLFLVPSLYMLQVDGFARTRAVTGWVFARGARPAQDSAAVLRESETADDRDQKSPRALVDL